MAEQVCQNAVAMTTLCFRYNDCGTNIPVEQILALRLIIWLKELGKDILSDSVYII